MVAAPLFHSWGFFHFAIEPADRLDAGPAAALRPRGDAAGGPGAPRPGARRGAGDDPADPAAAGGDASLLRPLLAADHRALGLGAARRAGDRVDGPLRRQHLQPLRLDRGRRGDGRDPRGPARRARAPPAGRRAAPWSSSSTRTAARSRAARSAGSSSATRCPSRATPAAAARRRSTACSAAATSATSTPTGRLFIDGRDDEMIVSGGENVFPREVEDLLADHESVVEVAVIGVEDEEFGQRLKAFVVLVEGAEVSDDDLKGHVKAHLAAYKAPARVRVPRRAAAQRDRQGPQARAPRRASRSSRASGAVSSASSSLP